MLKKHTLVFLSLFSLFAVFNFFTLLTFAQDEEIVVTTTEQGEDKITPDLQVLIDFIVNNQHDVNTIKLFLEKVTFNQVDFELNEVQAHLETARVSDQIIVAVQEAWQNDNLQPVLTDKTKLPVSTFPWIEDFSGGYLPAEWTEAQGILANPTIFNASSSDWTEDGFGNNGTTGSAKINIYGSFADEWLFTPVIQLGAGGDYTLEFDLALTTWNTTNPSTLGVDDIFAVVISTDGGATYSSTNVLQQWDNTTPISNGDGDHISLDLSAYSGDIQLGFYGYSDASNADNDLFIDNVKISYPGPEFISSSKTAPPDVFPGAFFTYTILITNSGLLTATDVTFNDPQPAGVTQAGPASVTLLGATQTGFGNTFPVTWAGEMPPQTGALIEIPVTVVAANDSITNTATISDVALSAPVTLMAVSDLVPVINVFPWSEDFENGGTIPTNWEQDPDNLENWLFGQPTTGDPADYGADVDHTFGDSSHYIAWIDDSSPNNANPAGLITPWLDLSQLAQPALSFWYQNLQAGDDNTLYSTLHIDVYDGSTWYNDILVVTDGYDEWTKFSADLSPYKFPARIRFRSFEHLSNFESDISLDDILVSEADPDLSTSTKLAMVDGINNVITYVIAVKNSGFVIAPSASVTDIFPSQTTYVPNSAVASTGIMTVAGNALSWTGDVLTNTTAYITFTVDINPNTTGLTITNTAYISQSQIVDTVIASVGVVAPGPNFVDNSFKDSSASEIHPGALLTYTLYVENSGDGIANNVTLNDPQPNGVTQAGPAIFTLQDATQTSATSNFPVTWQGEIPPGGVVMVEIPVTVTALAGETITNTATVSDSVLSAEVTLQASTFITVINTFPWLEDFENGGAIPPKWINVTGDNNDEENWLFGIPSSSTGLNPVAYGPRVDHTSGFGYVAWVDDSEPPLADPAALRSPIIDTTALTQPVLSFWVQNRDPNPVYHNGDNSVLYVDVFDGSTWHYDVLVINGLYDDWTEFQINLTSYQSTVNQLQFRAFEGSYFQSDLALDDVMIADAGLTPFLEITKNAPNRVLVGEIFTYTISVVNSGLLTAPTVVLTDIYPSEGGTYVPASAQASLPGLTDNGTDLNWSGSLGIGQNLAVMFQMEAISLGYTIHNTAIMTGNGDLQMAVAPGVGIQNSNAYCEGAIDLNVINDMVTGIVVFPDDNEVSDVDINPDVWYTVTPTATGQITLTLLSEYTGIGGSDLYVFEAGNGCDFEQFTQVGGASGSFGVAEVNLDAMFDTLYYIVVDDPAPFTLTLASQYQPLQPRLAAMKTGPDIIFAGQPLTYTIFAENFGELPTSGAFITDTFPAGTYGPADVIALDGPGSITDNDATGLRWDGILNPGEAISFTFTLTPTDICYQPVMTNTAYISAANLLNDTDALTFVAPPPVMSFVDVLMSQNFEENDGGLMPGGEWEYGTPDPDVVGGPPMAHSGTNLWGTDLDDNYDTSTLSVLTMTLDLTDQGPTMLSWWQWVENENCCDEIFIRANGDLIYGQVAGGIPGDVTEGIWQQKWLNLSAYAGQIVQLTFTLQPDFGVNGPGWYIDDIDLYQLCPLLTKEAPATIPAGGAPFNYIIRAKSIANLVTATAVITDMLDANLTYAGGASANYGTLSENAGLFTWEGEILLETPLMINIPVLPPTYPVVITNTVWLNSTDIGNHQAQATTIIESGSAIMLQKTVGLNPAVCAASSSLILATPRDVTYCYKVTNIGSETLAWHTLVDDQLGELLSTAPYTLAPGQMFIYTTTTNITTDTINTAVWTATNGIDTAVDTATAQVQMADAGANIALNKTVGVDLDTCSNSDTLQLDEPTMVKYCYEVTNTGTLTLTIHSLMDNQLGSLLTDIPYTLASGETFSYSTTTLISETTVNSATWTAMIDELGTEIATATAWATVTVVIAPIYSFEAMTPVAAISGNPGETVTYTIWLTNTGNMTDAYDIDISGQTWPTTGPSVTSDIVAGDSTMIEVSVTIPLTATSSDTATITLTSQGDTGVSDSLDLTTFVTGSATQEITFIYHDLEDVVQVGESLFIAGDFNNWDNNVDQLSGDAGATIFSITLSLDPGGYEYKYVVDTGTKEWEWLNTNNRAVVVTSEAVVDNYRRVVVGWANLEEPASLTTTVNTATASISGQVYIQNVTTPTGEGRAIMAQLGYGAESDLTAWAWADMAYSSDSGDNDLFAATLLPTTAGVYSYATRYNGNWGTGNPYTAWTYGDLDGLSNNGFTLDQTGILTVTMSNTTTNNAPVAVPDGYTTAQDTALIVSASGVLENDTDAEGDALTAVLDSATGNGSLTLDTTGAFSYTPTAGFNGVDSFTYHANDGSTDSNTTTVTITVTAIVTMNYGVEATAVDDMMSGAPESVVTYTILITNTGDTTDTYALTYTGLGSANLPEMVGPLTATETGSVVITLQVPANATNNESFATFVTITSQGDSNISTEVTLTTTAVIENSNIGNIYLPLLLKSGN